MTRRPRPWRFIALCAAVAVAFPPSLVLSAPRNEPCRVKAADLRPRTIAGLRIDRTERRGQNWLRYTGRYRDTYFVVETGACERYVRQLIVISPVGADPWSRLESLRRLFNLPPAPLDVDQRDKLRRTGRLALTYEGAQMTYDYKAVGIVSIISLGFAERR